jgi:hypothetical protein
VIERGDKVAKRIEREERERERERRGKVVRTALRTSNNCPEDEFG